MPKTKRAPQLENLGSLITYKDDGVDTCLGDLFVHEGKAFDPYFGMVDVTPEQAAEHNRLLSQCVIEGLDERCQVGQGATFYLYPGPPIAVKTWRGDVVTDAATRHGVLVTFTRKGKTFQGRVHKNDDFIFFERTA